jgi:hypothetical protein
MKNQQYPLNRRLGGLQAQSGRFGEEKNLLHVPGFESQVIQFIVQSLHIHDVVLNHRE